MRKSRFTEDQIIGILKQAEAKSIIEAWRQDYNSVRPHSALAGMSPEEYRRAVKGKNTETWITNLTLVHLAG